MPLEYYREIKQVIMEALSSLSDFLPEIVYPFICSLFIFLVSLTFPLPSVWVFQYLVLFLFIAKCYYFIFICEENFYMVRKCRLAVFVFYPLKNILLLFSWFLLLLRNQSIYWAFEGFVLFCFFPSSGCF